MSIGALSALTFLSVTLLAGFALKKRVEELAAEVKQNQSEIAQLKVEQEKMFKCATKVGLEQNDLVALVKKTDLSVSDSKKELEDHDLRIKDLKIELRKLNDNNISNSLAKPNVKGGITMPDGSFISNSVSTANKISVKADKKLEVGNAKSNDPTYEERSAQITKQYQVGHIRDHIEKAALDYYKQMLPPGTSMNTVSRVLGTPDQVNFSGAWVYDGIVEIYGGAEVKTTYLKITFSDNGEIVSVE